MGAIAPSVKKRGGAAPTVSCPRYTYRPLGIVEVDRERNVGKISCRRPTRPYAVSDTDDYV